MTLDELYNDPYYWSNNKRRMHGLKPIRNNKKRIQKIIHSVDLFNAIELEVEKSLQGYLNSYFNNFVDIDKIEIGEKK